MQRFVLILIWMWIVNGLCQDIPIALQESFAGKKLVGQIMFEDCELRAIDFNDSVFVIRTRTLVDKKTSTRIYNRKGDFLWEPEIDLVKGVFTSKHSNMIVLTHNWRIGDRMIYSCYSNEGEELWKSELYAQDFAISDDGKYGITKRITTDEESGWFQIFDMNNGNELPNSINNEKYSFFHAEFINNAQVAVLLQRGYNIRRKEWADTYYQARYDLYEQFYHANYFKGSKLPTLQEFKEIHFQDENKKYGHMPAKLIIYDIPTQSALFHKSLYTGTGKELKNSFGLLDNIVSISPDRQKIALRLAGVDPDSTLDHGFPKALYLIMTNGQDIFSHLGKDRVEGLYFIDNDLLMTYFRRSKENHLSLFRLSNPNKVWDVDVNIVRSVDEIYLKNNILFFTSYSFYHPTWSEHFQLDINTGESVGDKLSTNYFYKVIDDQFLIIDIESKQIRIYN